MSKGITGVHKPKSTKDEWLTPPELVKALGTFNLDPCSPNPKIAPWKLADNVYWKEIDGLSRVWLGRVWLNPPYGKNTEKWLNKLKEHGNGICLIFARTETSWFFDNVWNGADAVFFIRGRLSFYHVSGVKSSNNSGGPSCLVIYGINNIEAVKNCNIDGKLVILNEDIYEEKIQS